MSWKSCIKSTICCSVFLFIIIGLPILIYKVVVKPKDPTFTLEHASVTGLNLTSDDHLIAFFDVVIKADNPNHILKLKYNSLKLSIHKSGQKLAVDALHKFSQRKRNVTFLTSKAVALNVKLKKAPAFDVRFESGLGYLGFVVRITGTLLMHLGRYNLDVNCNAIVNITTSPAVSKPLQDRFSSKGCSVHIGTDYYYY